MKDNTAVEKREKAEKIMISDTGIKVKITYPDNVPEIIKQAKINRIYDILTKNEKKKEI